MTPEDELLGADYSEHNIRPRTVRGDVVSSSSTATVAATRSEDSQISQRSSRFTQSDDSKATVGAFSIHFTDGSTPSTTVASNSERFRVVPARNNPAYQHDDDFS